MHLEWTLKSHQEWHWLIRVMHRPHASHGIFVTTCGRCERWQQWMLLEDDLLGIVFCPIYPILPPSVFQRTLESSYHPSCRGHLSSLSVSFIFIGYLHVEANCLLKVWEQEYHLSNKFREDLMFTKLNLSSWGS